MNATRPLAGLILVSLPLLSLGCGESRAETREAPKPVASAVVEAPKPTLPAAVTTAKEAPAAPKTLRISAVGDCTLATEFGSGEGIGTFPYELKQHGDDAKYPFSGVLSVLAADDLTIANLETTLTTVPQPAIPGRPRFRGKPEYTAMLTAGSVEIVNVANNHSNDFGREGYAETTRVVREAGVAVAGNEHVDRRVVKGVEVVNLGFTGGDPGVLPRVERMIKQHKTEKNLLIVSFHWGMEGHNEINDVQRKLGHAAIDAGADLVLGSHPHVLQGIEEYKGRRIVYSLGNFVFGGHSNPKDKDTMIYQETFAEKDGRWGPSGYKVIPARLSTVTDHNDYRPVLLEGEEADRVIGRVKRFSEEIAKSAR